MAGWLTTFLTLSTLVSLCIQRSTQNNISGPISAPHNLIETSSLSTIEKNSFFDVAQQVLHSRNNTNISEEDVGIMNDTLIKIAQRWKELTIHGDQRSVPIMFREETKKKYTKMGLQSNTGCHLHPLQMGKNTTIHEKVLELVSLDNKLITFTIYFPEYHINPLKVNMSNNYKPDIWFRTYDTHAYTLLSLPFNYKVLSLYTLWFGTAELDVEVIDYPKGCFPKLSTNDKLFVTMDLVANDFKLDHESPTAKEMIGHNPHVCHQIIKVTNGQGHFSYECCQRREEDGQLECAPYEDSTWLGTLFLILLVVDIFAFLFGPQLIDWTIFSDELHVKPYEVELDSPIDGTMHYDDLTCMNNDDYENENALSFRTLNPSNEEGQMKIVITKLLLKVDHRLLISARDVPVGFFKFIYDNLFQCRMKKSEPCKSCFKSPICWLNGKEPTSRIKILNRLVTLMKNLKWQDLMYSFGKLLMVLCLPFPFYIRLFVYYMFESVEVNDRKMAINNLGVTLNAQYNLFYSLTPTHPFYQVVYAIIIISLVSLLVLRHFDSVKFDQIVIGAFRDLREIRRFETFRLFSTHLLLPFETCGICGILLAPFYWIAMILASCAVIVVYSFPTIYLTFRFLVPERPEFLRRMQCNTQIFCPKSKMIDHLSKSPEYDGLCADEVVAQTTYEINIPERRLLLHRISPGDTVEQKPNMKDLLDTEEDEETTYRVTMAEINKKSKEMKSKWSFAYQTLIGFFCVLFMICITILFSEVVGFLVEVAVFTFMGTVVNASSAGKFITVALTSILYCVSIFRNFHGMYAKLIEHLFQLFTDKLDDDIKAVTEKPADQQNDTAYRYLNDKEITKLGGRKVTSVFKTQRDNLVWKCKGLVLFVDARDTPRIPKKFFLKACEISVSGCPGKIVINLLRTMRRVIFMILFLGFVLWVVILFHSVYTLTTTQQLLFTLSGSFLPFLIRFFMQMRASKDLNFNDYAFQGSVNEILIRKYEQSWPVCGFEYRKQTGGPPSRDKLSKSSFTAAGDIVSTCDRGIQTENDDDIAFLQSPNDDNEVEFKCEMHWESSGKGTYPKSRRKSAKQTCCIDIDITQKDKKDARFKSDVIGTEVHKPV